MIDNYTFGPFPTGSVQIYKMAVNIKKISPIHGAILIRAEHYVNGAHIQIERIKKDAELMSLSSPDEDGWDIGLWCQMLDAHYFAGRRLRTFTDVSCRLSTGLAVVWALFTSISVTSQYLRVISRLEWPSIRCRLNKSPPFLRNEMAAVWRKVWGEHLTPVNLAF